MMNEEDVKNALDTMVAGLLFGTGFTPPRNESMLNHVHRSHRDAPTQKQHPLTADLITDQLRDQLLKAYSGHDLGPGAAAELESQLQLIHSAEHTLSAVVVKLSTQSILASAEALSNVMMT